ncbi:MAG: hypothetical protein EZS28_031949 [Streblomastix strix]|uniref:Uncharacterized protein n=1 Tax=Streblomastix strix TaxID=222440 RepID=A0A5J4UQR9_9EUKA|nr:MAG: hypothetical protein EZS28_031949 [Streblomastix strix]
MCHEKDKYNSRGAQQTVQNRRLTPSRNLSRSNYKYMEYPTKSRLICITNNKIITSFRDSQHKGLTSPMDRRILQHMDERNRNSYRGDFSNSNRSTVVGPAMVYMLNESDMQVPYPWTVKPMSNQKIKDRKPKKFFTTWEDSSNPHGPEVEKEEFGNYSLMDRDSKLRDTIFMQ